MTLRELLVHLLTPPHTHTHTHAHTHTHTSHVGRVNRDPRTQEKPEATASVRRLLQGCCCRVVFGGNLFMFRNPRSLYGSQILVKFTRLEKNI